MRWGLLGAGAMGREALSAAADSSRAVFTAVASRSPAKARAFADATGVEHSFGSYADLLASDVVDAVYIALPVSLHTEWTIAALRAGKHVLCEKPFALSAAEAAACFDAADGTPASRSGRADPSDAAGPLRADTSAGGTFRADTSAAGPLRADTPAGGPLRADAGAPRWAAAPSSTSAAGPLPAGASAAAVPGTLAAAGAARAEAESEASGVVGRLVCAEGFMYRHHPQTALARSLVASGAIGSVAFIRSALTVSVPPDDIRRSVALGGGALLDLGCYCVSATRLFGGPPINVSATYIPDGPGGVDLRVAATLTLADGVLAQFDVGLDLPRRDELEVVGTEGRLVIPDPWLCRAGYVELTHGDITERRFADSPSGTHGASTSDLPSGTHDDASSYDLPSGTRDDASSYDLPSGTRDDASSYDLPSGTHDASTSDAYRFEFDAVSAAILGGAPLEFGRDDAVEQASVLSAVRAAYLGQ
ncbi:Oxidoreductase family, NAD-binding Rossmann fold [Paractinoplanes atraurantiacus]|uniref:Oxidoreductase family, NAD-binding Rossmann fold n=1 Tax=Paractinoplanes atraurantiacus TaxID=1036182 RepID=A0A285KUU7_9ACTN|nr:Oxidoreductase family, NAD-binding Rossmann fold [Actinoplanes atraurantiacus]